MLIYTHNILNYKLQKCNLLFQHDRKIETEVTMMHKMYCIAEIAAGISMLTSYTLFFFFLFL